MSEVASRATIDLDSLVRQGALLRRYDTKFVIDASSTDRIERSFGDDLLVLSHLGRTTTGYETVYHDDATRRSYRDHAQGRRRRFKIRTRRYAHGGPTMLEVKVKLPRGQTDKVRWDIGEVDPSSALSDEHLGLVHDAIVSHYGFGLDAELEPVVMVAFERTTLFLPEARERVTLDSHVVLSSLRRPGLVAVCDSGARVAEVKSPRRNSVIVRRLATAGVRPIALSKYGLAVGVLEESGCPARWRAASRLLAPASAIRV